MRLVFDMKLRRPGCVILQAAMGGDTRAANRLPAESWLVAPTDDMRVYEITEAELDQLAKYLGGIYGA